jgi:hypothetical protein
VDCKGLVKRLNLPTGWAAPAELADEDIPASAPTLRGWLLADRPNRAICAGLGPAWRPTETSAEWALYG